MVHVNYIKCLFHLVLGAPIPILAISGNIVLLFLDYPRFKIFKYLNINIVGVPSFSVDTGLGSVTSYSLRYFKDRSFFLSNLDKWVVSEIILTSLGYVLVHYFAATMLF